MTIVHNTIPVCCTYNNIVMCQLFVHVDIISNGEHIHVRRRLDKECIQNLMFVELPSCTAVLGMFATD